MNLQEPGTSSADSQPSEDITKLNPFITFSCSQCDLKEECLYGELNVSDGFYPSKVFFIKDPFTPPVRVKARKPKLADFLIMGSTCSICESAICFNKACSVYFGAHFCANCINREHRRFPPEVINILTKSEAKADTK